MGIFTKAAMSLIIPALSLGAADALAIGNHANFDLSKYAWKGNKTTSPFESDRMRMIMRANQVLEGKKDPATSGARRSVRAGQEPIVQLGPSTGIKDIDTPWGDTWFYTSDFRYTYIKVSEDYNRPILQEYEFTIYDASMKEIGKIKDKMTYETYDVLRDPNSVANKADLELYGPYHREVAVAACELTPIVTKNYFNTDEKYEIMVGLVVQTTYYVNNYHNRVYQLGGETYQTEDYEGVSQTYNKMITTIPYQVGDVYATTDESGKEKVYMTLMEDIEPESDFEMPDLGGDGEGGSIDDPSQIVIPGYWDNYCGYGLKMVTYRGVRPGEDAIQPIHNVNMYLSRLAGDMQSSPFMMTLGRNGKMHMIVSYYEDTFWNPYHSPLAEMTMRENNKLVVDIYREKEDGNGFDLIQTARIPTYLSPSTDSEKILASWFSVGDFRYRQDVRFGEDGKVSSFIVTKQDYVAGNDDATIHSYYVYNGEGTKTHTLFERSQSFITMSDLPGYEPQTMFIDTDYMGDYVFHFVDLESVKEVLTVNYKFDIDPDSDPERMTSNIDRVIVGDTYKYANELRVPSQDEEGNDIGRVLWFNRDGSFDRIDEVNMGKNVYYALSYIDSKTLNHDFFHKDSHNEYMMLVKRAYPGQSPVEELLIAQARSVDFPEGRTFLTDGPDERGTLSGISVFENRNQSLLLVSKIDKIAGTQYWDVYALPFETSGVEELTTDDFSSLISYDGDTVSAEGRILLFNLQGMKVADAEGRISVKGLDAGIYIVMAAGETRKIVIR
ncbi:MAG: hypothetical protein K2O56_06735 [Muribaculaceae bacterium]|nr:hypothetical protein [Muribaculaceae bacterium]